MSPETSRFLDNCMSIAMDKASILALTGDNQIHFIRAQLHSAYYEAHDAERLGMDPAHLS